MSAKKKRRKIVVNSALAKVGECGPNCKKTQMANKLLAEDDKREVSTLSFVKTVLKLKPVSIVLGQMAKTRIIIIPKQCFKQ